MAVLVPAVAGGLAFIRPRAGGGPGQAPAAAVAGAVGRPDGAALLALVTVNVRVGPGLQYPIVGHARRRKRGAHSRRGA